MNKSWVTKLGLNTLALGMTAFIMKGVYIEDLISLIGASIILGILNTLIKPIFIVLTLPINVLTLGLFTFVINSLMLSINETYVQRSVFSSLNV
ncbi:MAG: hypothetical protein B6I28_01850 [Fusobacteriia bacterium 4572_132]|nr:MAG: hypothetical protein B6I28_01850 [Fusobacteriia bacterium 4572_132]